MTNELTLFTCNLNSISVICVSLSVIAHRFVNLASVGLGGYWTNMGSRELSQWEWSLFYCVLLADIHSPRQSSMRPENYGDDIHYICLLPLTAQCNNGHNVLPHLERIEQRTALSIHMLFPIPWWQTHCTSAQQKIFKKIKQITHVLDSYVLKKLCKVFVLFLKVIEGKAALAILLWKYVMFLISSHVLCTSHTYTTKHATSLMQACATWALKIQGNADLFWLVFD